MTDYTDSQVTNLIVNKLSLAKYQELKRAGSLQADQLYQITDPESAGGNTSWGLISGTLSNQTDLQNALDAKANDSDVVKLTGNQTITGEKTIQNSFLISKNTTADGTASSIATSQEYGLYIKDKNSSRIGNFFGGQLANGNIRTYMCACRPVNETTIYKYAEIQQYPDGTGVFSVLNCNRAVAPTPTEDTTSSMQIDTVGARNTKLQEYQTTANLVTSVSGSSTDSQYPSAKLFYDTCGDIEALINAL